PSAGFLDVDPAHQAAIDCLVQRRIARGYEAGEFRGRSAITRAQAAVMLQRLILDAGGRLPETGPAFADLVGDPNEPAIRYLAGAGIVNGLADGSLFGPGQPISR